MNENVDNIWEYVYWNVYGKYYIDKASMKKEVQKGTVFLSCTYAIKDNWFGRSIQLDSSNSLIKKIKYLYIDVCYNNSSGSGLIVKPISGRGIDCEGNFLLEMPGSGDWEPVKKDSMYECVYNKAKEILLV